MVDRSALTGRVAVVTGSAGLLGRRHAAALALAGATVVATDLDGTAAKEVAAGLGARHLGMSVDVTDEHAVSELRRRVVDKLGRIDALVCDAALDDRVAAVAEPVETFTAETFRRVLDVNVVGSFLCARELGAEMAATGGGSIVLVGSTYGLVGPDQRIYRLNDGNQTFWKGPAYPASKGAVIALSRHLAAWWGSAGVRVNVLCPGGVDAGHDPAFVAAYADRTPLRRMAEPEDYDGAVVFLCSDASAYMTGAALVIDGGWTCW